MKLLFAAFCFSMFLSRAIFDFWPLPPPMVIWFNIFLGFWLCVRNYKVEGGEQEVSWKKKKNSQQRKAKKR
jgi:hypothetical protein